jgi:hypothetical protein
LREKMVFLSSGDGGGGEGGSNEVKFSAGLKFLKVGKKFPNIQTEIMKK